MDALRRLLTKADSGRPSQALVSTLGITAVAVVVLVATLVAGGTRATVSEGASPAAGAAGGTVKVTLAEWFLRSASKKTSAGRVRFVVRNAGRLKHEFVVLRTKTRANRLPVRGKKASEKGKVGEIGSIPRGRTKRLSLRVRRGHYALICNLSGHYTAGQRADFNVG